MQAEITRQGCPGLPSPRNTAHFWLSSPGERIATLPGLWSWVVSPEITLLFPRAALEQPEHGVCFFIPLRPNTWQTTRALESWA